MTSDSLFVKRGSGGIVDAVDAFQALHSIVSGLHVGRCEPGELEALTAAVRVGQEALDRVLLKIAVAAERQDEAGRGRGAQATMLGDGSRVRGHTARKEVARAKIATGMSRVGDAVDEGRIGSAKVDAIAAAVRDLDDEQRDQLNNEDLIEAAASLPADVFARRIRNDLERIKGDNGLADTKTKQANSSWKHWIDRRTGMGKILGEFDPERYEAITQAVEGQLARLANEGGVSKSQNLAAQAAFELLIGEASGRRSGLPHLNVVVDLATLQEGVSESSTRETAGGHPLPPESIARLACDAVVQRVLVDELKIPIDVGCKHRTATDAQWHALRAMYRSCAWWGCDRPLAWCQAHHIHEWEHGGNTDLCNLIPLCSRHHHAVHEGGWSVKLCPETRRLDILDRHQALWRSSRPDRIAADQPHRSRRSPGSLSKLKRRGESLSDDHVLEGCRIEGSRFR